MRRVKRKKEGYWDAVVRRPPIDQDALRADFHRLLPQLRKKYPDEWVTILHGKVVGHFKNDEEWLAFLETRDPMEPLYTSFVHVKKPIDTI